MSESKTFRPSYRARFGGLPHPSQFTEQLVTIDEIVVLAKVERFTITGSWMNKPVNRLCPDAYEENPKEKWNDVYFTKKKVEDYLKGRKENLSAREPSVTYRPPLY